LLNDPVAERAAVAGACQSRDHYLDVCDVVRVGSFVDEANAALWGCVAHVYEDAHPPDRIDVATLMSVATQKGFQFLFERKEDLNHVRRVLEMDVASVSVRKMAAKVRKLHIARQAAAKTDEIKARLLALTGSEPVNDILSCLEGPLLDFSTSIQGDEEGIKRLGQDAEKYVLHKMANPVQRCGLATGFKEWDEFIGGGIRENSVNVIAARMKQGKSQFAANVGVNVALFGSPALILDTEMSEEELLDRILARIASIPAREIERGLPHVTDPDQRADFERRLLEAARKLKDIPLDYRVIRGMAFEDVLAETRRWLHKTVGFRPDGKAKPCVLVYDYLKLLDSSELSRNVAEYQQLGFMMTSLKNFVGRYHIGNLTGAQTNRDGIDGEDTNVVGGSDRIGQYCTSLSLLKEKTPEERAEVAPVGGQKYTHKLIPLLTRWGERFDKGDYINLEGDYKFGRLKEGPRAFKLSDQLLKGSGGAPPPAGAEVVNGDGHIQFG
jgi:replicative DNA helicase